MQENLISNYSAGLIKNRLMRLPRSPNQRNRTRNIVNGCFPSVQNFE